MKMDSKDMVRFRILVAATFFLLLAAEVPAAVSVTSSLSALQQHHIREMLNSSGCRGEFPAKVVAVDRCSGEDVEVYQCQAPNLSSGIPAYSVEIINACASCTVYGVHLACGDFASTDLINPAVFRRLSFDDCLVKDGGAIQPGESVTFHYSNSFAYPLAVAAVSCN